MAKIFLPDNWIIGIGVVSVVVGLISRVDVVLLIWLLVVGATILDIWINGGAVRM